MDFWSELLMRLHKDVIPSFRSHPHLEVPAAGEPKLGTSPDPKQSLKEAQTPARYEIPGQSFK